MDEPEKNLHEAQSIGRATKADFDRHVQKGLPVAGYKPTQPQAAIDAVNLFKQLEERCLRHIEGLNGERATGVYAESDKRMLAIGRTQLQIAFMVLNRAIFQPGRVTLPEDGTPEELVKLDH